MGGNIKRAHLMPMTRIVKGAQSKSNFGANPSCVMTHRCVATVCVGASLCPTQSSQSSQSWPSARSRPTELLAAHSHQRDPHEVSARPRLQDPTLGFSSSSTRRSECLHPFLLSGLGWAGGQRASRFQVQAPGVQGKVLGGIYAL